MHHFSFVPENKMKRISHDFTLKQINKKILAFTIVFSWIMYLGILAVETKCFA